jgi:methionyl-tRNA formyltransferase
MTVVVLCDSMAAAARLWRGLAAMPGIDLHFFVFGAGLLSRARRTAPADWKVAARLLLSRRLVVTRRGPEHRTTLARIRALQPEIGLHATCAMLRQPLLACFRRGVLEVHTGLLPASRGRAAMEWSILEARPAGVSVFFVDTGIDTGREIVLRRELPAGPAPDVAAAQLRLRERDAEFFREALERLRSPAYRPEPHDGRGRRFYPMSRLFTAVVEEALKTRAPA